MESTDLEALGLQKSEAKVYLALLELGSSTTGPIIDKARVSPSKIYWVIEKLLQKGLVSYIIKSKRKYYSAASPQKIMEYLEQEQTRLESRQNLANSLIPKLAAFASQIKSEQKAEIFVGFKAMKNAYYTMYDCAKKGDEHLIFLRSAKEESIPEAVSFFMVL